MEETKKPTYNLWQNTGFMLRLAWKHYKSIPVTCVLMAFLAAAKAAAELLISPAVLAEIEQGAPVGRMLRVLGVFVAALLLLDGLIAYVGQNTMFPRSTLRTKILCSAIAEKFSATSYPNTLDTGCIERKTKAFMANDTNLSPTEAIWTTWTTLLTNLLGFALYLALLAQCSAALMALTAATAVAGYFASKHINEWSYRHRKEEERLRQQMYYYSHTASARPFAKDMRIFGLRDWVLAMWGEMVRAYRSFIARRERAALWGSVIDAALSLLRGGIAYAYLLWFTLERGLPASQFLLYFAAISGFTQWVTGILNGFSELHKQSLELCAIREFLDWPEPFRFENGKPLAPAPDGRYELRLEDVSYRYPEAQEDTISHMDLTVRHGEKLAIVGLNGAGKTTLVKLLCGLLDPSEGRVLLNGEDIRQYNRRQYYALFTAVFQEFSIIDAPLAENVAQRMDGIDVPRVWQALEAAGLTERARQLPKGIDTPIGRSVYEDGVELSGGETQRLMLARALYKDAPILMLDEPTAALDPIAEDDIYQKYDAMTQSRTAVFISHRLASTRFCDRILFLEKGRIAEEGTHDALMHKGGGYAELFAVQSKYYKEEAHHE